MFCIYSLDFFKKNTDPQLMIFTPSKFLSTLKLEVRVGIKSPTILCRSYPPAKKFEKNNINNMQNIAAKVLIHSYI